MITEVYILKDIILHNKHHEQYYYSKKGVIVIINNDKNFILDLESNTDITNSDYIKIRNTNKTKKQIIFKNIIYDEELLEKLSNN